MYYQDILEPNRDDQVVSRGLHDRVGRGDAEVLAGDRVAIGVGPSLTSDGRPSPKVIPRKWCLDHGHIGRVLKNRVVDGDAFDGSKLLGKDTLPIGRVPTADDGIQMRHAGRLSLAHCLQDRGGFPHEDARVPEKRAGVEVFLRHAGRGLFAKPTHRIAPRGTGGIRNRVTTLDVSETLGRIRGRDSKGHQALRVLVDNCGRLCDGVAKCLFGANHMIGGHHCHRGIGVMTAHEQRGEGHTGSRVALAGLPHDSGWWHVGELMPHDVFEPRRGHHERPLGRDEPFHACDRVFQQALFACERQQLLWEVGPACRPKTGAGTTGHHDRMQHFAFLPSLGQQVTESQVPLGLRVVHGTDPPGFPGGFLLGPATPFDSSLPREREQRPPLAAGRLPASIPGVQAEFLDFCAKTYGQLAVHDIPCAIAEEKFVWIDLDSGEVAPDVLQELLPHDALSDFDPVLLTSEGCCAARVSELRKNESGLQVSLVGLVDGADGFVRQCLQVIVGEGFLVTVRRGPSDVLREVRRAYLRDFRLHATTPSFLLYEIFDEQVDQYLRLQNRLETDVEETRQKLLKQSDEATLLALADASNQLLALRKQVMPARRVLEELVARKSSFISDATQTFFGGMIATLERLLSDITSNLGILESSMNLSLTMTTLRTNVVMNRLVVVSTVFLPLTFLCGVYGMNFEGIPELGWVHGYKFFWIISTAITVSLVMLLRRAKLL